MPLESAHVFASHIGHTGKTTLSFQMSCMYATKFPGKKVLVIDFAEEGDLTKRMMGGVDEASKKAEAVFGGVFSLLKEATDKSTGMTNWLFGASVDLSRHAVQVNPHNKHIPENLYLISSGAWPATDAEMNLDQRRKIIQKIKEALDNSPDTWKLFCDTDGDRRPKDFTKIAYGLCPEAIVPLHCNKGDLDRTETMLGVLNQMRQKGEVSTQILLIVWNFVSSQNNTPLIYKGMEFPFTPTKVNLEILDSVNQRMCKIREDPDLAGLFVHGQGTSNEDFIKNSTIILRHLADTVQKSAEESGRPFTSMKDELGTRTALKIQCGSVEYSSGKDVIEGAVNGLQTVMDRFEAMTVSA
jgi:cellulose biosynthesis protein BcsQ